MADRTLFPRERPSAALERRDPMGYANRPALSNFNTPFSTVGEQTPFYTVDPSDVGGGRGGTGGFADLSNLGEATPLGLSGMNKFAPAGTKGRGTILKIGATELAQSMVSMAETMFPEIQGLGEWRRDLDDSIEQQITSLRPELQKQLEMEFLSLDKDDSVLRNPSALISHFMRQIPNLAFTLVPAGGAASIAGRTVAKTAGAAAGQRAAGIAGGAAGGAATLPMIGGYTAGEISTGIEQAPLEVLRESPRFQQLEQEIGEDGARETLKRELRGPAALEAGGVSAIFGAVGGAFFGRLFGTARAARPDNARMFQKGTRSRSALEQFGAQGLTEAPQEGYETFVANRAAQDSFDPGRGTFENIGEAATAGGVIGGLTGGLLGGALGGGRRRPGTPSTDVDPGVKQALNVSSPPLLTGPDTYPKLPSPEAFDQQNAPPPPLQLPPPNRPQEFDDGVRGTVGTTPFFMGTDPDPNAPGPGASAINELGSGPLTDPRTPSLPLAEPVGDPVSPPRRTAPRRDPEQAELPLEATTLPSNQTPTDPVQAALFDTMLAEADTALELRSTLEGMQRNQIARLLETREPVSRRMTKSAMVDHITTRYGDQVGENFRGRMDAGRQRQLDLRTTEQLKADFVARPAIERATRPDAVAAEKRLSGRGNLDLTKARLKAAKANVQRIARRSGVLAQRLTRGIPARLNHALKREDSSLRQDVEARRLLQDYVSQLQRVVAELDNKKLTGAERSDAVRRLQDVTTRVADFTKNPDTADSGLARDILKNTILTEQLLKEAGQPTDLFGRFSNVKDEAGMLQAMAEIADDLSGFTAVEKGRPKTVEQAVARITADDLTDKAKTPEGGWKAALNDMLTLAKLSRTRVDEDGSRKQLTNEEKLQSLKDHFAKEAKERTERSSVERAAGVTARAEERRTRPQRDAEDIATADRVRELDAEKRTYEKSHAKRSAAKSQKTKGSKAARAEALDYIEKFLTEGVTQTSFVEKLGAKLNANEIRRLAFDLGITPTLTVNPGDIRKGPAGMIRKIFQLEAVQDLRKEADAKREKTRTEFLALREKREKDATRVKARLAKAKEERSKLVTEVGRLKKAGFDNEATREFFGSVELALKTMLRGFRTGRIRLSRDNKLETEFTVEHAENLLGDIEREVETFLFRVAKGDFETRPVEASGTGELADALNAGIRALREEALTRGVGSRPTQGVVPLPKKFIGAFQKLKDSINTNFEIFSKWATFVRENDQDALSRASTQQQRIISQSLESVAGRPVTELDALMQQQSTDDTTAEVAPEIISRREGAATTNELQARARKDADEAARGDGEDAGRLDTQGESELVNATFGDDLNTPDQLPQAAQIDSFAQPRMIQTLQDRFGRLKTRSDHHDMIVNFRNAKVAYAKDRSAANDAALKKARGAITAYNQRAKDSEKNPYVVPLRLNANEEQGLVRDPRLDTRNPYDASAVRAELDADYRLLMKNVVGYMPGQVTVTRQDFRNVRKPKPVTQALQKATAATERKRELSQTQALLKIAKKLAENKPLTRADTLVVFNADPETRQETLTRQQRELIREQLPRINRKMTPAQRSEAEARAVEALGPQGQEIADAIRTTDAAKRGTTRKQSGERVSHSEFGEGVVVKTEGDGLGTRVLVRFKGVGEKWLLAGLAGLERSAKGINFMPAAIAKYSEGYRNAGRQLFTAIESMPKEGMNLNDLLRAMEGSGNALVNMLTSALQRLDLNVKVQMSLDNDLGQLGEYNPDTRTIILNHDLLRSLREKVGNSNAEGTLAHVFLHEVVHAATVHGLTTNRRVARQMESLRKQVYLELSRKYNPNGMPYGLRNLNEFIAEAFTNPAFQEDLKNISWGRPGRVEQMWTAFRNMVRTVINRLSGGRFAYDQVQAQETTFDSIMAARDDLFMTDAQVTDAIRLNPERISSDPILFAEQFASGFKMAAEKTRNISTGFMTRQQLTDWYGKFFDGAMENWNELNAKREAWMRRYQATANDISVAWSRLRAMDPAADQALSDMLIESRNLEVAPQHSIDHKLNKHLQGNAVLERRYYKARSQYEALAPETKALYDQLTTYFNEDWNATQNKLIANVLNAYGVELDYRGGELDLDALRTIRDEELSESQKKSIRALTSRRRQNRGNYFPSMRFGDHVVVSMMESKIEGSTRKEVEDQVKAWKLEGPTNEFSEVELGADGVWRASVKSKEVEFFESSSEAEAARNRKLADPNYFDVEPKALKQSLFSGDKAVPGWEFMGALETAFANKPDMINTVREVYLQLLPETSMRKHEMRRGKIKGASMDTHRTFRAYAMKASYHRAQLEFGRQIGNAVQGMRDVESSNKSDEHRFLRGQILKELAARDAKGHNAVRAMPVISKVTDLGFIWYLLSPSYWMVNATQPIALGLPFLSARYGAGASAAAMKRAYGDVMGDVFKAMADSKLGLEALRSYKTQEEFFDANDLVKKFRAKGQNGVADMLQEVAERGLIDVGGFAASLRENASTSVTTFETRWTKMVEMARTMPHIVEVMNRSVIGIAAYNLEMAQNTEGDPALRQQKAVDAALKAIRDTQFDYSGGNKARFMSSNTFALAGPLFLFKQYMQHIYFTFAKGAMDIAGNDPVARRTAAKQLMFIFGTHAAFAGVLGAMFEPIKWAMGMVWALGFQDKDDPVSFDVAFRQAMSDYLGPDVGEAVSRGLPRLIGADVSTRIGLNNLLFFDRGMGPADRNAFANTVVAALGPIAAMGERATRAAGDFQNGNTLRAMENATPKLFRDWIRAYRLNTEGMLDYRGNLIVDSNSIGPGQLFLQSLGITPAQMAEVGEARRVIQGSVGLREERRQRLMQQYYRAAPGERSQIMHREIRRFNEVNPDSKISRSDLLQGLRQRRRFEEQQIKDLAVVRGSARENLINRARFANTGIK